MHKGLGFRTMDLAHGNPHPGPKNFFCLYFFILRMEHCSQSREESSGVSRTDALPLSILDIDNESSLAYIKE